ncbi:MAG TPA: hypothetical protein VFH61_18725, partial [Thermoleophilia bacterium]|nr:hypothetical protein [Thermoleophilia bacterium]
MNVVTELKVVRGGRVALHIDDSYLCTVSQAFVARWRLFPGREFDEESLGAMCAAAMAERAVA